MNIFSNYFSEVKEKDIFGLTDELKAIFISQKYKKENKNILVLVNSLYEASKIYQKLLNYEKNVLFFPMDDFITSEVLAVSPEFKLYIIQDYQRLKSEKSHQDTLDWNVKRLLSKANYRIHTDAIKQNLIPPDVSKINQSRIYANEADLLNVALFGKTASEWRNENPDKKNENIRDYATIEQLLVLSSLESLNALLIEKGVSQDERLKQLNSTAIQQLKSLTNNKSVHKLDKLNNETKSLPKK